MQQERLSPTALLGPTSASGPAWTPKSNECYRENSLNPQTFLSSPQFLTNAASLSLIYHTVVKTLSCITECRLGPQVDVALSLPSVSALTPSS